MCDSFYGCKVTNKFRIATWIMLFICARTNLFLVKVSKNKVFCCFFGTRSLQN